MKSLRPFIDWIVERALPAWSDRGFDAAAGRFRERLDWSGAPLPVPHRAMVQARQIYVFAHAAQLGWFDGSALAERAMASMLRDFGVEADGMASFAFSIDGGGRIVSDARDAYTHAFVLFAVAWLYRLNGDAALLALADRVTAFIEAHLFDGEHGGMFDAWPATDLTKRQNPLMHLLEACLALERSAPGRGYAERAAGIVGLFERRLFDAPNGVLREYFARDWAPHPDPAMARAVEPGHHFEWVWLLREYQDVTGDDAGAFTDILYRSARTRGIAADGLVYDELSEDLQPTKPSHRVWPHTEAIKAAAVRHEAGDADALPFAEAMAGALLDRFLDRPFAGGWIDHLGPTRDPIVDYVPASSLYHLFFAAAEADRRLVRREAAGAGDV